MTTRPDKKPRWATVPTVNGTTGKNNVIEPTEGKKDLGWDYLEKPARNFMNWVLNKCYEWILYFDENQDLLVKENTTPDLNMILQAGSYIGYPDYITEHIINGTFDSDISNWVDGSEAGGAIAWNASGYLDLVNTTGIARGRQTLTTIVGQVYKIPFDKTSAAGLVTLAIGTTVGGIEVRLISVLSALGSYQYYFKATTTTTYIQFSNTSVGTTSQVDNISVVKSGQPVTNHDFSDIINLDWTLGANWAISGGQLTHTPGDDPSAFIEVDFIIGGNYIQLVVVSGMTAGSVIVRLGGEDQQTIVANGTYYINAIGGGSSVFHAFTPSVDFDGSIDTTTLIASSINPEVINIPETVLGPLVAPSANPRIDRVLLNKLTGLVSITTGAEAGSPTPIALLTNELSLAQVAMVVSQTEIVNADITDERHIWDGTGVELSSDAEAIAKTDPLKLITPSNLLALDASNTFKGLIEIALNAEAIAKTDTDRALVPSNLAALVPGEAVTGLAEIATQAEVNTGTDDLRYVTPLKLKNRTGVFRGCKTESVGSQSINNTTNTTVTFFTTEDFDTDSIHDNSTNPERLTVPTGVTFIRITATIEFSTDGTGVRNLGLVKNSTFSGTPTAEGNDVRTAVSTSPTYCHISEVFAVSGGDYFTLGVWQNSGGALNISGSRSWFTMEILE